MENLSEDWEKLSLNWKEKTIIVEDFEELKTCERSLIDSLCR